MASIVPGLSDLETRSAQLWPVLDERQIARNMISRSSGWSWLLASQFRP